MKIHQATPHRRCRARCYRHAGVRPDAKTNGPGRHLTTLDGQSSVPDGLRGKVQFTPARFITGRDSSMLETETGELDFVRLKALLDKELS